MATEALVGAAMRERMAMITGRQYTDACLPVEMRLYPPGSSMPFHRDMLLFSTPQLELILTLENTSDSTTCWNALDGTPHRMRTRPNSLIAVMAGGAPHCVSRSTRGERLILKGILVPAGDDVKPIEADLLSARSVYEPRSAHGQPAPGARAARRLRRSARPGDVRRR